MLILTTAVGYTREQVLPFLVSLRRFSRCNLVVVTDTPAIFERFQVECVEYVPKGFPLNSDRFFAYRELLSSREEQRTMITDIRDVVFQYDPEEGFPSSFSVFCEYEKMTLGSCPYNSRWLREAFGDTTLQALKDKAIICAGVTCGTLGEISAYVNMMCTKLEGLSPRLVGHDQAVHNVYAYNTSSVRIIPNEEGPVYTVGYMPRESLKISPAGYLHNRERIPCVIHQYDRHKNLTEFFLRKFS